MPNTFFTEKGFKSITATLTKGNLFTTRNETCADQAAITNCCLGIGMALRDIHRCHFAEDGEESCHPAYVLNAPLDLGSAEPYLKACDEIKALIMKYQEGRAIR